MKVPVDPRESAADERSIDEGLADADAGNLREEVTVSTTAVEKIAGTNTGEGRRTIARGSEATMTSTYWLTVL